MNTASPATTNKATVTTPNDREIIIVRIFNASRDRVWRAMTEPELLAQWWGRGNRVDVEASDLKPGGKWRMVEHADGGMHGFQGEYQEIDPPKHIVMTFIWDGMPDHVAVNSISLEEMADDRTRMTTLVRFDNETDRDGMLNSGMEAGMNQSHAALDKVLAAMD
ncbi:MAG: SRPBCC family protein [Gemmatimonadaceae bacterium]